MNYLERAKKFRTKKRLGQNFLIDEAIIDKIIDSLQPSKEETILEIGAGAGFLTEKLAQKAGEVVAVELDEDAITELKQLPETNIRVVKQDILKTDLSTLVKSPVKIAANIPYYITGPIIAHILGEIDCSEWRNRDLTREIILMVQYEVAKRLVANETSTAKEYGLLSILANFWCDTEFICRVSKKCFYPVPKVDSALVKLTMRKEPLVKPQNPELFKKIIKAAFNMRRKTLKNALAAKNFNPTKVNQALETLGLNPDIRGEKLSTADYKALCDLLDE